MSNDINDKNYPFSGSAEDLSSLDGGSYKTTGQNDKNTKSLQDLISSGDLSLSQQLIKLRQSCNLNIEQLADITKIRAEFIEALENEDFSKLPGLVFAKGFVKNLARFYKISDVSLLQAFDKICNEKDQTQSTRKDGTEEPLPQEHTPSFELKADTILDDATKTMNSQKSSSGKGWKFFTYSLVVLAILMILGAISYFKSSKDDDYVLEDSSLFPSESATSEPSVQDQTEPSNTVQAESAVSSQNSKVEITSDTGNTGESNGLDNQSTATLNGQPIPSPTPEPSTPPQINDNPLISTVSVGVTCEAPVRTKVDSNPWKEEVYQPGQTNFEFKNVFHIFIPDSACVNLTLNGVSLGDLTVKGKERRLTFFHNQVAKEIN